MSTKNDEGLVYLREARNSAEHGLGPFAQFSDPAVNIVGMAKFSGNSFVHISNCTVNGVKTGTFSLSIEGGKVKNVTGTPNTRIHETPAAVYLVPIHSMEKKRTFPVPKSVMGKPIGNGSPEKLANLGMQALEGILEEFKELK